MLVKKLIEFKESSVIPGPYKLLRTPRPEPDESYDGYFLRLTEDNGYESMPMLSSFVNRHSSKFLSNGKLSDKAIASAQVAALAELTGSDYATIEALRIHYEVKRGFKGESTLRIFGRDISRRFVNVDSVSFCPRCLKEKNYIRNVWHFVTLTVCPVHKIQLLKRCPKCKRKIGWDRGKVSECICKFDFREAEAKPVKLDSSGFSLSNTDVALLDKYQNALTRRQAARMLGIWECRVVELAKSKVLPSLQTPTSKGDTIWAFEKAAVEDLIAKINKTVTTKMTNYTNSTEFVTLRSAIARITSLGIKTSEFISDIISKQIIPRGGSATDGIGNLQFSKEELRSYFIKKSFQQKKETYSLSEAAELINVKWKDKMFLYRLVDDAIVKAVKIKMNGRETVGIKKSEIVKFRSQYATLNTLSEIIKMRSIRVLPCMFRNGIWPISGPLVDGKKIYLFRKADLKAMNFKKINLIEKMPPNVRAKYTKYLTANRTALELGITKQQLASLADKGVLHPAWQSKVNKRIQFFALDDINKYKRKTSNPSSFISRYQAAEMLGVSIEYIKIMLKKGILQKIRVPYRNCRIFVKKTEVGKVARLIAQQKRLGATTFSILQCQGDE